MPCDDWIDDWLDDAPCPTSVCCKVTVLVAGAAKHLTERRLLMEDHTDRLNLVLAAAFYGEIFAAAFTYNVPDTAEPCLKAHKSFAERARRTDVREATEEDLAELAALAAECRLSRGSICKTCGLPRILHAAPDLHPTVK